jgi:hypothetical protein
MIRNPWRSVWEQAAAHSRLECRRILHATMIPKQRACKLKAAMKLPREKHYQPELEKSV